MGKNHIHIDESTHQTVPTTAERVKHTLLALLFGFLLVNIIGFWIFPGVGIIGFYMFSSSYASVSFVSKLTNIAVLCFLAICGVLGWFNGKYYTKRLKDLIEWWKFW